MRRNNLCGTIEHRLRSLSGTGVPDLLCQAFSGGACAKDAIAGARSTEERPICTKTVDGTIVTNTTVKYHGEFMTLTRSRFRLTRPMSRRSFRRHQNAATAVRLLDRKSPTTIAVHHSTIKRSKHPLLFGTGCRSYTTAVGD